MSVFRTNFCITLTSERRYSNAIPADPKTVDEVQSQFNEVLEAFEIPLHLNDSEKLALLRAKPALEIIDKIMKLNNHTFRPVRDGHFFPLDLFSRYLEGDFATEFKRRGCQLLIGEVRDEVRSILSAPLSSGSFESARKPCIDKLIRPLILNLCTKK